MSEMYLRKVAVLIDLSIFFDLFPSYLSAERVNTYPFKQNTSHGFPFTVTLQAFDSPLYLFIKVSHMASLVELDIGGYCSKYS